jgi:hypothetical protein
MRDGGLQVTPVKERSYAHARSRPIYPSQLVRHADTVAEDYGDNGYGYTNPSDLVRYDLSRATVPPPVQQPPQRDGVEGRTGRPSSITGDHELTPRPYDNRERGPPPTTRGFDKIPARGTWEQQQIRMTVAPPQSSLSSMDPIQGPAPFELPRRISSRNSSQNKPISLYHDREPRWDPREDYYEVRDEKKERRSHHHERYDDDAELGGFGVQTERQERPEQFERNDRVERPEKVERTDRVNRRGSGEDRSDHKEYKSSREAFPIILSLAGAALAIKAVQNASQDSRGDRDDRRRDYDEESPPSEDRPVPRDIPPPPPGSPPHGEDFKVGGPLQGPVLDLTGRDPKERKSSKDKRENDLERWECRRRRSEEKDADSADSHSERFISPDDSSHPVRRESRLKRVSGVATEAFNLKDTMDLKALREALNSNDSAHRVTPKEPVRIPRESVTKDPEIRKELNGRRPREPLASSENRQIRIVSPPGDKVEEKPVKSILRTPREKFPEDPAPIREGVAPLKDAKKDGIPPDARWTKISRKLVNPEALEAGKERFEAREDFVIVLRVLTRDEVQGYAEVTQRIRGLYYPQIRYLAKY